MLGIESPDEANDAPSSLHVGRLAHDCLERFYRARSAARALPVTGGEAERRALEAACDAAFADAEREGERGHLVLWEITKQKLREELWRLVAREAEARDARRWRAGVLRAVVRGAQGSAGAGIRRGCT